jgi:hypothetical protein
MVEHDLALLLEVVAVEDRLANVPDQLGEHALAVDKRCRAQVKAVKMHQVEEVEDEPMRLAAGARDFLQASWSSADLAL